MRRSEIVGFDSARLVINGNETTLDLQLLSRLQKKDDKENIIISEPHLKHSRKIIV